jgi:nicotinate-nucleotide pyrophosphorylase
MDSMTNEQRQALRNKHTAHGRYGKGTTSCDICSGYYPCDVIQLLDATENLKFNDLKVEVECDHVDQALEAVAAGAEAVLLDNMTPEQVKRCVGMIRQQGGTATRIEVSGGVTLATAPLLAAAGPDCISVGALTHSAVVADFGLDLIRQEAQS